MPAKLFVKGALVETFTTRAEALVACFDRKLVYDQHSRMRNRLLPWVKIVGEDDEDAIPNTVAPIHPLDRR